MTYIKSLLMMNIYINQSYIQMMSIIPLHLNFLTPQAG